MCYPSIDGHGEWLYFIGTSRRGGVVPLKCKRGSRFEFSNGIPKDWSLLVSDIQMNSLSFFYLIHLFMTPTLVSSSEPDQLMVSHVNWEFHPHFVSP